MIDSFLFLSYDPPILLNGIIATQQKMLRLEFIIPLILFYTYHLQDLYIAATGMGISSKQNAWFVHLPDDFVAWNVTKSYCFSNTNWGLE